MKILVTYDTFFGNTKLVAESIGAVLSSGHVVRILHMDDLALVTIVSFDVIIVGSPGRNLKFSFKTKQLISSIPINGLEGKYIASFDTRLGKVQLGNGILKFLKELGGNTAGNLNRKLEKRGGYPLIRPIGFFIDPKNGNLHNGELLRAQDWARTLDHRLAKGMMIEDK